MNRKILFSFITLVMVFSVMEIVFGYWHYWFYRKPSQSPLATVEAIRFLKKKVTKIKIEKTVAKTIKEKKVLEGAWEKLFSPSGQELLTRFQEEYEKNFKKLTMACKKNKTHFLVVYIPSQDPDSSRIISESVCRNFYSDLTQRSGVEFIDLTSVLRAYRWSEISLSPDNSHFSRFGNACVARALAGQLKNYRNKRSPVVYNGSPEICGDLKANTQKVWDILPSRVYRVYTNKQGFRNIRDLEIPKTKQRILFLGDSFTFGPYLPNNDTYPAQLQRLMPETEIVNGGICGYTITDEVSFFTEKARLIGPDLTVLQVLDNDLFGMFYFKQNDFDRKRKQHKATNAEKKFIRDLKSKSNPSST